MQNVCSFLHQSTCIGTDHSALSEWRPLLRCLHLDQMPCKPLLLANTLHVEHALTRALCCRACVSGNSPVVDSTSEFAIVVSYRLGQHQVVMAAEVDCHDPAKQGAEAHKTNYYLE